MDGVGSNDVAFAWFGEHLGGFKEVGCVFQARPDICCVRLQKWRANPRRVPFRLAPRPSLDLMGAPISARHEAYA